MLAFFGLAPIHLLILAVLFVGVPILVFVLFLRQSSGPNRTSNECGSPRPQEAAVSGETTPSTSIEPPSRIVLRRILKIAKICCLVAAMLPGYSHEHGAEYDRLSFSLGLPFSPWLAFTMEDGKTNHGTG